MIVEQIVQKAMEQADGAQAFMVVQETSAVDFENDRLKRIEGDVVAKGAAKESARATEETAGTPPGASPDKRTPAIKPAAEPASQKAPLPAASAQ